METKRTNKEKLVKGLKRLALSLVFMFAGPSLVYVALSNPEKSLYIPILIVSIILCISAIVLAFKGLQTIMKSLFE